MRRDDAITMRRMVEAIARRASGPSAREVVVESVFAGALLALAIALAVLAPAERASSALTALAFTVAFAVAARVDFASGAGFAVPTQLVFVPMLLLLPTPMVPLLVAAALFAVAISRGGRALATAPLAIADAWFALAPAVVVCALGAQTPGWGHWPAYVAALAAQFAVDGAVSVARMRACTGVPMREAVRDMYLVYRVDALLAPVGLLSAIAAAPAPAAALLVLPLVLLIRLFAREREERIAHSLELGRAYRGTALLLRDVLEEDDEYTGRHTEDVVGLAVQVAERMGLDEDARQAAELGALLHDIGKIAIPDAIINKPGPLDAAEWALMKTHTVAGQRMLDRVGGLLGDVGVVVRGSHERWDGGGYPDGLAGAAIPLASRIVSACDAYNAMTTDRSYRRALPLEVAARELRGNAGSQFDPGVVDALLDVVGAPAAPLAWEAVLSPVAAAPAPGRSRLPARSGPRPGP
jgi:HD-GYP domain-containing protein (c-di-GMP phosphodiesterase class II)